MPSNLEVTPVKTGFAARVSFDIPSAGPEDIAALKRVMRDYAVLVLPGQQITYEQQLAFAEQFGPIDQVADIRAKAKEGTSSTRFDRQDTSEEIDPVKQMLATLGTTIWHTDGTYKSVPSYLSMLYGITVTEEGGETQFADLRAAYDNLPENLRAICEDLVAEHSILYAAGLVGAENMSADNRAEFDQCNAYDLVRTLPESGRKSLFLSAHAQRIIGLPVPQGRMILRELTERATLPDNTYTHKWTPGDLVIWDNRCTLHRLRPYRTSDKRVLQRVSTADVAFPARDPGPITVSDDVIAAL